MPRLLAPGSWPLTVKIAGDLLVAALVPLAVGSWLATSRGMQALEAEERSSLELLAGVTAAQLDQLLVDTRRVVAQVAGDERIVEFCAAPDQRGRLAPSVQHRLELVTASSPDFASIFVTDAEGIGLASTSAANVGQDLTFREYWRRGRAGESYRSGVLVGKNSFVPGIYFSEPVRRGDGIVGVAVLKLSGTRVWEIVDGVRIAGAGHAMLTDRHGVLLAHPDKELLYRSLWPLSPEIEAAIDPETTYSIERIDSVGIEQLRAPLLGVSASADETGARSGGAAQYTRVDGGADSVWVVGFAPLAEADWIVSATVPQAEFAAPLLHLRRQQRFIVVAVAALAVAYAIWRARSISRPIVSLTGAAKRLAEGDLGVRAEVSGEDEVGRLGQAFNAMVPRLREHLDLRRSLAVAMDVQQALLPAHDPSPDGLDIAGRSTYCDETGGDYYDFIDVAEAGPTATLIALGDVMGHGVASALLMASARAALRAAMVEGAEIGALLGRVNRVLAADARHGRFMTMVVALIDRGAGSIRWASAAHDPIIRFDPATDGFDELEGADLPLGVIASTAYEQFERRDLRPGQILLLGTDGIWEMRNDQGEMFGKERLKAVIRASRTASAAEIAAEVERALAEHRGARRIEDDVTYVIVRIL